MVCVELSVDYTEEYHPIYIEAQYCKPKEEANIEEMKEELLDKIAEMFGVGVLSIVTDIGVFEGGSEGIKIIWWHRSYSQKQVYRE